VIVSTDIGGTFTDYIIMDSNGLKAFKRLNSKNLEEGIKKEIPHADEFHHGSTVGINALIERKGVDVLLITTKGFGSLYRIGRQNRKEIYSFIPTREKLPVKKVIEVDERISHKGKILKELDENELREKIEKVRCKAAAIVFLHSYANPEHEIKAKKIAEEYIPYVFTSHEVRREIREYERESTTIVEAYIYPIVKKYLDALSQISENFYVMQSNGGKIVPRYLKGINTLMSGPAGGVAASEYFAHLMKLENVITYDMGGTSADIGMIVKGKPLYTSQIDVDGIPIRVTSMDIISIGAGGGSIAWLDDGLSLKVGPQSAGADPGPACYARGGKEFTVTDANFILGILGDEISGVKLDKRFAENAAKRLGDRIGLSPQEISEGVRKIVNNNMALAIKKITLSRGFDPRNFVLLSFGGAGPMHACSLAEMVGIEKIVVPPMAGAFSSLGILLSPLRYDSTITILSDVERGLKLLPSIIDKFRKKVRRIFNNYDLRISLQMRYRGQGHEISVPLCENPQKEFEMLHRNIFGFTMDEEIEIVNIELVATAYKALKIPKVKIGENRIKEKRVYRFEEKIPVYEERRFSECEGPCIIEEDTATVLVEEGWYARKNEYGAILMERIK